MDISFKAARSDQGQPEMPRQRAQPQPILLSTSLTKGWPQNCSQPILADFPADSNLSHLHRTNPASFPLATEEQVLDVWIERWI